MLPFVGVPPQKMLGFVRLFSPFSGTAPPPLAQSFPPLQYRFEAFFSLVDPPKEQRFKRTLCRMPFQM